MIQRGTNHVIFSRFEITERIRRDSTLVLIEKLMWYYETWSRLKHIRDTNTGHGDTEIAVDQTEEFHELMAATKKWLQPDKPPEDDVDPNATPESVRKLIGQPHNPSEYGLFPSEGGKKVGRVQLKRKRVPLK